jgi:perosamine synthetase
VVEHLGATPIFCDVDLTTFNIDVVSAERLITSRTIGIIPVHLFGLCADMDAVSGLAQTYGLWVVEDAACGFGSRHGGRHAGTFEEMGCFSFHPRKSITTGEGGMIVTNDERLDALCRSLRDHGATRKADGRLFLPDFEYAGYNYRMTDLQGALGCAQMDRAPAILGGRLNAARRYDELLADIPWLRTPAGEGHSYQSYVCLFAPEKPTLEGSDRLHAQRNALMEQLDAEGIATRQGTHAPVLARYYARKYGLRPEQYPRAVLSDRLSLALPLYPQITEAEQLRVARTIRRLFEEHVATRAA